MMVRGYRRATTSRYRKSTPRRRSKFPRKVGAYAQRSQITALTKRVNSLQRQDVKQRVYGHYKYSDTVGVSADYHVSPLVQPQYWSSVFGNPSLVENTDNFRLTSCNVSVTIIPNNESPPIDFTVFIVKAHPDTARKLMNETNFMSSLSENVDYILDDYGTGAMLNLSRFRILAKKRMFTQRYFTGAEGILSDGQNPSRTQRWMKKIKCYNTLSSATGNWKSSVNNINDINSKDLIFVLTFNNNDTVATGSPSLYVTALFTGYAT